MTVQDLITKLAGFPPDAVVMVADWHEDHAVPIELSSVVYNEADGLVMLEDAATSDQPVDPRPFTFWAPGLKRIG